MNVATISNDAIKGLATGIKAGTTDIEGKYSGVKDTVTLSATDP
jgi:hypothetical protein